MTAYPDSGVELRRGRARSAIDVHARLLLAWNSAINLTALRSPEQIARDHRSRQPGRRAAIKRLLGPRLARRGCSIWAAAPATPACRSLALPATRCALVDSVRQEAVLPAGGCRGSRRGMAGHGQPPPEIVALAERAEDLADEPDQRDGWELVVARAVGSLAEVASCLPLLTVGGHLLAWKRDSGDGSAEARDGRGAAHHRSRRWAAARRRGLPALAELSGSTGHVLIVVASAAGRPIATRGQPAERRRSVLR
jgi:hypothetical protein